MDPTYDDLVGEALAAGFRGWDFSWLGGRTSTEQLSWSYPDLARAAISESASLLDLDTGGGELLASLAPLPPHAVATEGWEPNIALARERLRPLGVEVRQARDRGLPAADEEFDLALCRHGAMDVDEIWRVLRPGGVLLTQQIGSRNDLELNAALGAPPGVDPDSETCDRTAAALGDRGFRVLETREEMPAYVFYDVAAVVYQLRAVRWQIPDFNVDRYDAPLRRLDARIRATGRFVTHDHRYLIRAAKPR